MGNVSSLAVRFQQQFLRFFLTLAKNSHSPRARPGAHLASAGSATPRTFHQCRGSSYGASDDAHEVSLRLIKSGEFSACWQLRPITCEKLTTFSRSAFASNCVLQASTGYAATVIGTRLVVSCPNHVFSSLKVINPTRLG